MCNCLHFGPIKANGIVLDKWDIKSGIISSDVGDKELLWGLLGFPIDEPKELYMWVRGNMEEEIDVCPWMQMNILGEYEKNIRNI